MDWNGIANPFIDHGSVADAEGANNHGVPSTSVSQAEGGPLESAAVTLPDAPVPKVRPKPSSIPSYFTTARPAKGDTIPNRETQIANFDISSLREARSVRETIRGLSKASPDLSATVSAMLRMAITKKRKAIARMLDGTIDVDGTRLLQQLLARMDCLNKYDQGFGGNLSIRSLSESLGAELLRYGSCSLELVLDKARLPDAMEPVSVTQLTFLTDERGKVPMQEIGGEKIILDQPTFFYVSLDQDLLTAYSDSPLYAAVQPILAAQAFFDDLRRIFRRAIHPRITVEINEEKWRKTVAPDVLYDQEKLSAHMTTTITTISEMVNGLNPEDAMVYFDSLDVGYLTGGNNSLSDEYKVLSAINDGKLSSGAKSMPVVLGLESTGSTNIASTQSMLFLKTVEGLVQEKLEEIYSRALTLALRLYGFDVYVTFEFDSIDLRPDAELEAFRTMKQSRILQQLSLGQITDEEACLEINGRLPREGAPVLSGTMFMDGAAKGPVENPYSNTSQGALSQNLDSKAPKEAKS